MADRFTGIGSVAAGLTVALVAVIPLLWLMSEPDSSARAVGDTAVAEEPRHVEAEMRTVVVDRPPAVIDELSPAVVRVLEAAGNVRDQGASEFELPASVVAVLVERDAVLLVPEDDTGEGSP